MIESPWREMSGDEALITFRFFVLPLFLLDAERFVREHITCMYPLLPAMQGVDHELIGKAMDELAEICHDQRVLSERFLWMEVLLHRTDTIDALEKVEIQRRLSMYEFLLESNPRIKRIRLEAKAEGKAEGERKGEVKGEVKAMRQSLIDVVEIRFPALIELATQRAKEMTNLEELRQLMRQATAAPDEATVRRILDSKAS